MRFLEKRQNCQGRWCPFHFSPTFNGDHLCCWHPPTFQQCQRKLSFIFFALIWQKTPVSFILIPLLIPNLFLVSQSREKDELDSHYRRDFITCDNQLLNGEMFLQVCISARWKHILNLLMVEKLDYMFPRCRPWTGSWWSLTVKESFSSPPTP